MHRLRKTFITLFTGMIIMVGVTATAQAEPAVQTNASDTTIQSDSGSGFEPQAGVVQMKNKATGRCLQGTNTAAVSTTTCSTSSYQRWTLIWDGESYRFKNNNNGRCLDHNSTTAYTHVCNSGLYQIWYRKTDDGYRFRNATTGKCLDSNSRGTVYPNTCNSGDYQKWAWL
ncbi:hypothetical protein GCM10029976_079680 [Kribbella albertanoniae]|uniref:Xylanase n=1 Tax=Kribbella albertanoniae TaxID=1266829 RepID=A0A4V2XPY0_9ACTN|nr:ricin-type beta-trefoil lectin domain protein [Kribbella albertanoniae]TDC23825.1 xylanase [Kribbella albertanoniae]